MMSSIFMIEKPQKSNVPMRIFNVTKGNSYNGHRSPKSKTIEKPNRESQGIGITFPTYKQKIYEEIPETHKNSLFLVSKETENYQRQNIINENNQNGIQTSCHSNFANNTQCYDTAINLLKRRITEEKNIELNRLTEKEEISSIYLTNLEKFEAAIKLKVMEMEKSGECSFIQYLIIQAELIKNATIHEFYRISKTA